jgi:hypothetical protein
MTMILHILLGAVIGGVIGFVVSRAQSCSVTDCRINARTLFWILGAGLFGAAVM